MTMTSDGLAPVARMLFYRISASAAALTTGATVGLAAGQVQQNFAFSGYLESDGVRFDVWNASIGGSAAVVAAVLAAFWAQTHRRTVILAASALAGIVVTQLAWRVDDCAPIARAGVVGHAAALGVLVASVSAMVAGSRWGTTALVGSTVASFAFGNIFVGSDIPLLPLTFNEPVVPLALVVATAVGVGVTAATCGPMAAAASPPAPGRRTPTTGEPAQRTPQSADTTTAAPAPDTTTPPPPTNSGRTTADMPRPATDDIDTPPPTPHNTTHTPRLAADGNGPARPGSQVAPDADPRLPAWTGLHWQMLAAAALGASSIVLSRVFANREWHEWLWVALAAGTVAVAFWSSRVLGPLVLAVTALAADLTWLWVSVERWHYAVTAALMLVGVAAGQRFRGAHWAATVIVCAQLGAWWVGTPDTFQIVGLAVLAPGLGYLVGASVSPAAAGPGVGLAALFTLTVFGGITLQSGSPAFGWTAYTPDDDLTTGATYTDIEIDLTPAMLFGTAAVALCGLARYLDTRRPRKS